MERTDLDRTLADDSPTPPPSSGHECGNDYGSGDPRAETCRGARG